MPWQAVKIQRVQPRRDHDLRDGSPEDLKYQNEYHTFIHGMMIIKSHILTGSMIFMMIHTI